MKILIPVDFSNASRNAAYYASEMTSGIDAEVFLLNMLFAEAIPHVAIVDTEGLADATVEATSQNCIQLIEELKEKNENLNFSFKSINDNSLSQMQMIEKSASDNGIDLIVIGEKGVSGIERMVFGSNAASLISDSNIPVITVPEHARFNGIKNLVYLSDLLNIEEELARLISFNKFLKAHIHILHTILPDSKENPKKDIVKDLLTRYKSSGISYQISLQNNLVDSMEEFIKTVKADLVVMFTHVTPFFEMTSHKSVMREIAFYSSIPVLSLKSKIQEEQIESVLNYLE